MAVMVVLVVMVVAVKGMAVADEHKPMGRRGLVRLLPATAYIKVSRSRSRPLSRSQCGRALSVVVCCDGAWKHAPNGESEHVVGCEVTNMMRLQSLQADLPVMVKGSASRHRWESCWTSCSVATPRHLPSLEVFKARDRRLASFDVVVTFVFTLG
ncbi:hypothetical protein E2C01_089723 [Portunus trituberculatus]|uniref:Secreted protein n=1 Tax=Portunus trituberculatus TaxID=210409 RepID=A0A5B7JI87_PORTR|nr:hypothetical protein [Portunus trituberculatus]